MYSFTYSSHKHFFGGVILGCGETRMWKIQALPSLMGKRHKQQWRLWVQWVQSWAGGCAAMLPLSRPGTGPGFLAPHRWDIFLRAYGSTGACVPGGPVGLSWLHPSAVANWLSKELEGRRFFHKTSSSLRPGYHW